MISRAIGNLERPIRLPIHRVEAMKTFSKRLDLLVAQLCRFPCVEELACATNTSAADAHRILAELTDEFIDLDLYVGDHHETLRDFLVYEGPFDPVEQEMIEWSRGEEVRKRLGWLSPRQEQILRMRFGIGMRSDYTLEEVGKQFSVTRERIRQIEKKALEKLQASAKEGGWRP